LSQGYRPVSTSVRNEDLSPEYKTLCEARVVQSESKKSVVSKGK